MPRCSWFLVALPLAFARDVRADDATHGVEPATPARAVSAGEAGEVAIDAVRPPSGPSYVFEAAARSAYTSAPVRGGVNPFGFGFGARAGLNLGRLYLGASVVDYLGGTDVTATDQSLLFGVVAGFNARVGEHLVVRPRLGFGDALLTHSEPRSAGVDVVTSASGSSSFGPTVTTQVKNVYVEPGIEAQVTFGTFFIGADVDALIVPGILYGPPPAQQTTWLTYSLGIEAGFRL